MFDFLKFEAPSPTPQQIAHSFRWLGWLGFGLQALLGVIPLLVLVTTVLYKAFQQHRSGYSIGLLFAIAFLIMLLFSIYWCFRYTQLAKKLVQRDRRPSKSQIFATLRLGLLVNLIMMAIAVLLAMGRVGVLTFKMLTLPQGAMVVAPNQPGTLFGAGAVLTPSNMIAVQSMINAIAAGLVGAVVALLLLYQVGQVGRHRNAED